jgi:UDP:flavonoid glycosyltransferase YjiC (YdhE family)
VLDAVDGLPARVIATTGPALESDGVRVPSSVELHSWLSHDEVLPRTSLVVGHGGQGTTMAALAHGVPLLVLPLDSKTDQPAVGRSVQRAGAGRVLSRHASPRRIRAAVEELLDDGPHRAAAVRLGEQIRATNGAEEAARVLEDALRRRSSPT